uniref:Uncharacterized protein n=1 Tax=Anguilla anguilla TaxID=7936 RepID=A0A0E9TKC5_ANGAN
MNAVTHKDLKLCN